MSNERKVFPVSTRTNTEGSPINAGFLPGAMVITRNGQTLYVLNFADPGTPAAVPVVCPLLEP